MCGRYSLAMRPSQIRHHLRTDLHMPVSSSPPDEGDDAPRQTHNFAPTYRGVVYRADVPDAGAGRGGGDGGEEGQGGKEGEGENEGEVQYKLQTMKWGLIPSWTKRAPDFSASLKTINCRSESLMSSHGMWTSMKQRKRCVVLVEGFYEWLHRGREKVPHYVKRKDGGMLCLAGLWDCVKYGGKDGGEGEKVYSYTIVTKGSNRQLSFLHDRMPVVLEPGGEEMWRWLDPGRGWGDDVARCLRGWEGGELEVFEVDRGVGKVGNDSPDFVVPVARGRGKIEGFFGGGKKKEEETKEDVKDEGGKKEEVKDEGVKKEEVKEEVGKKEEEQDHKYNLRNEPTKKEEPNEGDIKMESIENEPTAKKEEQNEGDTKMDYNYIEDDNVEEGDETKQETTKKEEKDEKEEYKTETPKKEEEDKKEDYKTETPKKEPPSTPSPVKKEESKQGIKREHDDSPSLDKAEPVKKATRTSASPVKAEGRGVRSSTRNDRGVVVQKTPKKGEKGEQKITGFFGKK